VDSAGALARDDSPAEGVDCGVGGAAREARPCTSIARDIADIEIGPIHMENTSRCIGRQISKVIISHWSTSSRFDGWKRDDLFKNGHIDCDTRSSVRKNGLIENNIMREQNPYNRMV
jgi:hypothetical protein